MSYLQKNYKKRNPIDGNLIREINLSLDNEYNFYQKEQYLYKNYEKKENKGKFDDKKAQKGFLNLIVTPYARKYQNEFGVKIPTLEREEIAKSRLRKYKQYRRENNNWW